MGKDVADSTCFILHLYADVKCSLHLINAD